jgi:hypothetical protein
MATKLKTLLGTDLLWTIALGLLSSSLAPATYPNYDNTVCHFFAFCHDDTVHPLQATLPTMGHYIAWLGLQGTVATKSLQPYYSAVNMFYQEY